MDSHSPSDTGSTHDGAPDGHVDARCTNDPTCAQAGALCVSATEIETCAAGTDGCLHVTVPAAACTTTVANATAECASSACGFVCETGYVASGGSCVPAPPRPVYPMTGYAVTTPTPTLTFTTPAGFTTAHVDVCKDRPCATILWGEDVSVSAAGGPASAKVGVTLTQGMAFWRLYTKGVGGTASPVTSATWQFSVQGTSTAVMSSWCNFADVNGDGYADLVVPNSQTTPGVVEYAGSATGINTTAAWSGAGRYGFGSGDVNGDGFSDTVVAGVTTATDLGVYFGGPAGTATMVSQDIELGTLLHGNTYTNGALVDVNGDGYADFIGIDVYTAGGPTFDVYYGGKTGLATSVSAQVPLAGAPTVGQAVFEMANAGDVNADGYGDLLYALPSDGAGGTSGLIYLYLGGPSGLAATPASTLSAPLNVTTFGESSNGDGMGWTAAVGDLNGDGYVDIVTAGQSTVPVTGNYVYVFYGTKNGLPSSASVTFPVSSSGVFGGPSYLTPGVSMGGDVNGDGYSDLVIFDGGTVDLFYGSATGISTSPKPSMPSASFVPSTSITPLALALIGDVNGDGLDDIATTSSTDVTSVFVGSASPIVQQASIAHTYSDSELW